jgi:hypothetical protein
MAHLRAAYQLGHCRTPCTNGGIRNVSQCSDAPILFAPAKQVILTVVGCKDCNFNRLIEISEYVARPYPPVGALGLMSTVAAAARSDHHISTNIIFD